jgi:hypothetical protein
MECFDEFPTSEIYLVVKTGQLTTLVFTTPTLNKIYDSSQKQIYDFLYLDSRRIKSFHNFEYEIIFRKFSYLYNLLFRDLIAF